MSLRVDNSVYFSFAWNIKRHRVAKNYSNKKSANLFLI